MNVSTSFIHPVLCLVNMGMVKLNTSRGYIQSGIAQTCVEFHMY